MRRALACLSAALLLAACSGENEPPEASSSSTSTPSPAVATAKPTVTVPTGTAPDSLVTTDLVVGTGPVAVPGQVLSVHYVGVLHRDGQEFDTSWGGSPFQFRLGNEDVIAGWDKGLLGMRVGGRRRLVIPPAEAYGPQPGHELQAETLVFVVDLISVGGAPAGVGETFPGG